MDTDHAAARCVVLTEHDAPMAPALVQAITAGGFEVSAVVGRWPELLVTVVEAAPDAVVIDLAMAGRAGVRLVAAVRSLAPRCRIAVVSELRAIDVAAVEAGASVIVAPSDLRPLTEALRAPGNASVQV